MSVEVSVEAQEVHAGDRVYDAAYFAPDKWCIVKAVTETFGNISIQLAHVTLVKHPREGVVVQRPSFYVTTFCNFAHRVSDGKPIEHECYVISPAALREEIEGVFDGPAWRKWREGPRRLMARGVRGE